MEAHLVSLDLSTFNTSKASQFYQSIFHWQSDRQAYETFSSADLPTAAIYEMPTFFQKINMPSFWMTYIQVDDIDVISEKAVELGAKLELSESNAFGKIALIRDPAGAGFTCYQGDQLAASTTGEAHGQWAGSELFISDLNQVEPFYRELFGWYFEFQEADRYQILSREGKVVAHAQVVANEEKGNKEYWMPHFAVDDLALASEEVNKQGGSIIYQYENKDGRFVLAADNQGAAFQMKQCMQSSSQSSDGARQREIQKTKAGGFPKWRSFVGLIAIYVIILLNLEWAWGLLFLFWVIPDLKTGTTYFIEAVNRRENPVLYWSIVITWLGLAIYLLVDAGWQYLI